MAAISHSYVSFGKSVLFRLLRNQGFVLLTLLFAALICFELFNFSTTYTALTDLLGSTTTLGIPWALILALAFGGIDFAGIGRITLRDDRRAAEPASWYLFAAWMLAATMNALLTWWGVSIAVHSHSAASSTFISPDFLLNVVPVGIAILVWFSRILLIASFTSKAIAAADQPSVAERPALTRNQYRPQTLQEPVRQPFRSEVPAYASGQYQPKKSGFQRMPPENTESRRTAARF